MQVLEPGTVVGDYEVTGFIASGGFGSVYAVSSTSGERAALKVLHPELSALGDPFLRFLREARVLDLVRHPNVVEILSSGMLADGRAYLVTEFLVGRDLEEELELSGPISPARTVTLLEPICDALARAHAAGIVHRDIKASNVFLADPDGECRVVLLDFGLAKVLESGGIDLTSSRMALGTPSSMSPEQIRGGKVDARSDVYGLGALTYHMLTGRLAFIGMSPSAVRYMHLFGQRPRASEHANVTATIDEVVRRAMHADAELRYPGVADYIAALRQAAAPAAALAPHQERARPAIAIYVDVRIDDGADADEALLSDIDDILDHADRQLRRHNFSAVLEHSNATLFARPAGPEITLRERREAALAAVGLSRSLAQRSNPSPRVHVNIALAADLVTVDSNERIIDGELLRIDRWAPRENVTGVVGTASVFAGIDVEVVPSDRAANWLRITAPGVTSTPAREITEVSQERLLHGEMMSEIGRRAVSMVHDMRSPITALIWNLENVLGAVERGEPITAKHRQSLTDALGAANQLKKSTAVVLESSSVRSYSGERHPVSITDVVDSALLLLNGELHTRAKVSVYHESAIKVLGARGRLIQVVVNLLSNAVASLADYGNIEIRSEVTSGNRVKLSVRDTGSGIAEDEQPRIFERFYTTKEADQGTGLGLSIVRQIVEEHGGDVAVFSAPDRGSCFTITLPMLTDEHL